MHAFFALFLFFQLFIHTFVCAQFYLSPSLVCSVPVICRIGHSTLHLIHDQPLKTKRTQRHSNAARPNWVNVLYCISCMFSSQHSDSRRNDKIVHEQRASTCTRERALTLQFIKLLFVFFVPFHLVSAVVLAVIQFNGGMQCQQTTISASLD